MILRSILALFGLGHEDDAAATVEERFVAALNDTRGIAGLDPVSINRQLSDMEARFAARMAATGDLGVAGCGRIAGMTRDEDRPEHVVASLMEIPGRRAQLLDDVKYVAIGSASDHDPTMPLRYWSIFLYR